MNSRIDVSICIVNWNTSLLLKQCLESIYSKTTNISFEVIIVDNNSGDDSREMIFNNFHDCKLIASPTNLGFSKANNIALKNAIGNYMLFLNPDTKLKTNAIYGMYNFLEKNSEYGAVGCKLLLHDESIQYICARLFPTPFNQLCYLTMVNRILPKVKYFSTVEMLYWDHQHSRDVESLCGACIFAPKTLLDLLSGFDENFFMYAEDVDLCYRIIQKKLKIFYLAEEEIYHFHGSASSKREEKYFSAILQRESNIYFFKKHFGVLRAVQFRIAVLLGSAFRLIFIGVLVIHNRLFKHYALNSTLFMFNKYFELLLWSVGFRHVRTKT